MSGVIFSAKSVTSDEEQVFRYLTAGNRAMGQSRAVAFRVRPCEYRDLTQVHEIELESFPDRPYSMVDFGYLLLIARTGFLVACADGVVVGYVIAMHYEGHGLIQSIAVAPRSRRRGAGGLLMRAAIGHLAKKFERAYLQVDASDEGAISFYHGLAFHETGKVIKRYYPNGHDAVEMLRELADTVS